MGIDVNGVVGNCLIEGMVLDEVEPNFMVKVVLLYVIPSAFVEVWLGVADEDWIEGL